MATDNWARRCAIALAGALAVCCPVAQASFHTYQIDELYSNADGTVQFIELHQVGGFNNEQFLNGHNLTVTQGGSTHSFVFMNDLPSSNTANTRVLIATAGFAALGIVTPDYIVPSGFLFINGGSVDYAGVDTVAYASLPTDGALSLSRDGSTATNSPTNFAGQSGSILPGPPPPLAAPSGFPSGTAACWRRSQSPCSPSSGCADT